MTCESANVQIASIIEDALMYCGKGSNSGVESQKWNNLALRKCNQILSQWSSLDLDNFYVNSVPFTTFGSKGVYEISLDGDIKALPFNNITSIIYIYAGRQIPLVFEPMQSFENQTYLLQVGLPQIYTFNNQKDKTFLRMLPKPFDGINIIINGKQFIESVELLSSDTTIPTYAELALSYSIANELYNLGAGVPNSGFQDTLTEHMNKLQKANKQDLQYEIKPAIQNVSAGKGGYYFTGGGYSGTY